MGVGASMVVLAKAAVKMPTQADVGAMIEDGLVVGDACDGRGSMKRA